MQVFTKQSKPIYLLTGATGLLGGYIAAALLRRRLPLAVLLRASNTEHARRRLKTVLKRVDSEISLPPSRIIAGDLNAADAGISEEDLGYLRNQILVVIHSAASIKFNMDERTNEPYQTNVQGTANLIAVLKELNVVEFHHISTAYLGSKTPTGVVLEKVPTEDQVGCNDYEKSKIQAELLIKRAFSNRATMHRPSIVVGDSQTGFTSTFNGFYAPLQLCAQFGKQFGFSAEAGDRFREAIGLEKNDNKNFVPVDWVAESIVRVATNLRGPNAVELRVLHWTNPEPTRCEMIQQVITDAISKRYPVFPVGPSVESLQEQGGESLDSQFHTQLSVYQTYFNSDPIFDRRHADAALPNTSCPATDYSTLMRLADSALDRNFGWPREPLQPLSDPRWHRLLSKVAIRNADCVSASSILRLCLIGIDDSSSTLFGQLNGQWFLAEISDDVAGTQIDVSCRLTDLIACITGTTTLTGLIRTGRILLACGRDASGQEKVQTWIKWLAEYF